MQDPHRELTASTLWPIGTVERIARHALDLQGCGDPHTSSAHTEKNRRRLAHKAYKPTKSAAQLSDVSDSAQTALQRLDLTIAAWNIVAFGRHAQVAQLLQRIEQDSERRSAGGYVRQPRGWQALRRCFDEPLDELIMVLQCCLSMCLAYFQIHVRIALIPGLHL